MSANATSLVRLHETLGHMGFDRMMRLIKAESTLDLPKIGATDEETQEARRLVLDCKACTQGKGTRTDFGHRGVDKGQGPARCSYGYLSSAHGARRSPMARIWTHVTDAFTSYRWFTNSDTKDQAASAVIDIVMNAQTQLGCKVKRLYADGGTEFVNRAAARRSSLQEALNCIILRRRTQQFNGLAENAVSFGEGWDPLDDDPFVGADRFWSWASKHATFVWNRTHVSRTRGRLLAR